MPNVSNWTDVTCDLQAGGGGIDFVALLIPPSEHGKALSPVTLYRAILFKSPVPGHSTPRPVWYAGRDSPLGELWTMLHPPYTLMVFSFVVMGASISPRFSVTVLLATLAAYFLGLGIGAHFLDQITGMGSRYVRHWSDRALLATGLAGLGGAVAIGVLGAWLVVGPGLLVPVAVQTACAIGYPLAPLFKGAFHRDSVFAVSWGSLPFLTSFYAQAGFVTVPAVLFAGALAAVAVAEIRISRLSRGSRRIAKEREQTGAAGLDSGQRLYQSADAVLQGLAAATVLLALGLLANRLFTGA
ncbi:MAG: hypothetical protein HYX97_01400 [Chloroflexi bacterium]|nr:hypothetical protein [Chloroflexota bacterium]